MSELDNFIIASDSIVEFNAYFSDIPQEEHTFHSVELQKEEIIRLWKTFRSSYEMILGKISSLEKEVKQEVVKNKYFVSYSAYVKCLSRVNELLGSFRNRLTLSSDDHFTQPVTRINLPPCDMENFNGDYDSWPTFRDQFSALYGDQSHIPEVEKLCHLIKKTKGEAHEIVRSCPFTNAGFRLAWQNLSDRYENTRVLINAQLKTLLCLKPIAKESGPCIKAIQRTINNCVTNLTLLQVDTENWDVIFVYICSTCLPDVTLNLWEQSLKNSSDLPSWKDMDSFLANRFNTLESVSDIRSSTLPCPQSKKNLQFKSNVSRSTHKINSFNTNMTSFQTKNCLLCQGSHPLRQCSTFLSMSIDERFNVVKTQKRCTNCLASSHESKKCRSQYVCSFCKQKHHSLLHRTSDRQLNTQSTVLPQTQSAPVHEVISNPMSSTYVAGPSTSAEALRIRQSYSTSLQSTQSNVILLGTAMVVLTNGDLTYIARALIDPASEASFISRSLQKKLSLSCRKSQTNIIGLSGAVATTSSRISQVLIKSPLTSLFSADVEVFVVEKLTERLPHYPTISFNKTDFSDLPMADQSNISTSNIDLLLGGDVYPQIILSGVRWNTNKTLIAQQTVFGWIITGRIASYTPTTKISSFFNKVDLNALLSRFWELEEVASTSLESDDDRYCEELYKKTTFRNETGRFVVSLPLVRNFQNGKILGPSRNIALTQFLKNETRLCRYPDLKSKYDNVVMEYLELKHMKRVSPNFSKSPQFYYLPHHAVFKPDSTTTKLRVVFNASCPSSNGVSLNDVLYPGPVLQADLPTLIIRWRLFKYVFNADIEKMYRQILVNPAHTPYQRILYRCSPQEDVYDYELNTVTFGVNCAPYLAIRTLLELANQCEKEYPNVSNIIRNFMYVDDVLFGSHDPDEAIRSRDDLIAVLASAGFSLRKWTANKSFLLKDLEHSHLLNTSFLDLSNNCTSKLLGLRWNAGTDLFFFTPLKCPSRDCFTKRAVLSEIAKLFDPAGWLAPKLITAKMLMQQIWKDNTDWDEVIKPSTLEVWQDFLRDYPSIQDIKIPRFVAYHPAFPFEIHGFCDASEKAFAATLYIRCQSSDGQIYVYLLAAKTKVAPLKFITLPRKELCGALLLANMFSHFQKHFPVSNVSAFMWTDSMIVLAWLQKPPYNWSTFVANRTASILEKTDVNCWLHVNSKDNPADIASRGCLASELINNKLWWHGPSWLSSQSINWLKNYQVFDTNEEVKPVKAHATKINCSDMLERFSDLSRALRVLSYVFRFFHMTHAKHKQNQQFGSKALQQSEIHFVKARLIIMCQRIHFVEYELLSQNLPISRKSRFLPFNPFIDDHGFMRVNGRLSQSPILTHDERFPKILPYSGRFTRLYLEMIHKITMHGGNSLLLRLMRNEFWVPRLKNLIKTIIHNCKTCVIFKQKTSQQLMGILPAERSSLSRPFTFTGVDFAGPFEIKSYAGRGCKMTKGYVLVFVCFSTKAIHLELTSEISTNAFFAAFARFFSRRGCPSKIYSDNGTAFVGASNILLKDRMELITSIRQHMLSQYMYQNVDWHFIPPGAPHMGGLWEAGVKSFKSHLKKITNAQKFTFEEFYTMLIRIEACLNSRPLCPINEDPNDLTVLTPGHFLVGSPLLAPAESDATGRSLNFVNRWQKLKILHHQFALLWKEQYLKELHKRNKWKYPQRDFQPNDLVVIKRENLPPTKWLLGRVVKVMPGSDSKVRVAQVQTSRGLIIRPIIKLVLLPPCQNN